MVCFQGQIVYEVVNDLPVSRLFAVNSSSGVITVINNLQVDDSPSYRVSSLDCIPVNIIFYSVC